MLNVLKCKTIDAYTSLLKKMTIGYPMENYKLIKEAMLSIDYIERYSTEIKSNKQKNIIDHYSIEFLKHK